MSYRTLSLITLHDGTKYAAVERVHEVVALRDAALADGCLLKLESGAIPTGQHFYLDPAIIAAIVPT
jgi:hypothetical protein